MSEKLYLSIADPCHEDWNKMTAVEQGRFCSSCQKNVVDFTTQSDEEIISFFNNYNGTACGRFTDDQLGRPIQQIELKPASGLLKYAAGLLLPAFLFVTKAKAQFKDQVPKKVPEKIQNQVCMPSSLVDDGLVVIAGGVTASRQQRVFVVTGVVIDEVTKEPMAGVSIMIKGTNQGVVTDAKGSYSIYLPSKKSVLQYSSVGYEMKEIKSNELNRKTDTVVKMRAAAMGMLSEVVVVGYESRRMGGMTGAMSIVTRNRFSIIDSILPAKIKVYPNPVAASGTINISFPNVKTGQYQIRMLNAAGQLFYSFQKQISGKVESEQIHLSNTTAPGMYIVQVLDGEKKLIQSIKLTIQ
ncbi:carboxypeptidase-like regulatory domain-containing protein [Lacibacter sp. H407]|uniref:carboxypeptidase-like regulatory domain-containing protein n=1 Tax=Lacibacter sp. H407 TaxID=3133423 RepID=UPI0030BCBC52